MDNVKYIKNVFKKLSVNHYKIIRKTSKELEYKNVFSEIFIGETNEDKLFVIFKYKNRVAKFSVSSDQSTSLIKRCIFSSLENSNTVSNVWHDFIFKKPNKTFIDKNLFMNANVDNYIYWLTHEIEKIAQKVNFDFNFVYLSKFDRYVMYTQSNRTEQYKSFSECVCMDNKKFNKKAEISGLFLNSKLAKPILIDFFKEIYPFKNIDFDKENNFSITAKAFSQLLNVYMKIYYASNIFWGQSFIKLNQLHTPISKIKFNIGITSHKGILFDGEGNNIFKKFIIKSGRLVNFISNSEYSQYLGINSYGNADLDSPHNISHLRLFFEFIEKKSDYSNCNIIIKAFDYIYIDYNDQCFNGVATYYCNGKIYKTIFKFNVQQLFENIYPRGNKYLRIDNVYCPDVLIKNNKK